MEKRGNSILMQKYEIGKLLGQGTFAKVHHARNLKTGESVAIKIIDKEKILKVGLMNQIKREISIMRLVQHPNIVQLYEVMASKTKIYFAMEYVRGGELFNKVAKGRLKEDAARKYFQQLIAAVDFCHSRGVYHRDLKPENLLLDESGNLKVSDFGLSALFDSKRQDGLLHTTCGTPAYVAPEVISKRGYDGEKADIWSCGVILFVLLGGYLPFHDKNLMEMYRKISRGEFRCPHWFPPEVRKLLSRILDPNPNSRIDLNRLMKNPWFKKGFEQIESRNLIDFDRDDGDSLHSVFHAFESDSDCSSRNEKSVLQEEFCSRNGNSVPETKTRSMKTTHFMNAFDIISLSPGFDLSGLFQKDRENGKAEAWFTTQTDPSIVVSKLEQGAMIGSFRIKKKDGMMKMQGSKGGRKGQLEIDAEIFEVAPSLHMVEVRKTAGDTLEYRKFCDQELRPCLKDVVWSWPETTSPKPGVEQVKHFEVD